MDIHLRPKRIVALITTLQDLRLYHPLECVAAELIAGRLSQETFDAAVIPVQQSLDGMAPPFERDNLLHTADFVGRIVDRPRFRESYLDLSADGSRVYRAAAILTDIAKLVYTEEVRRDHTRYRNGQNPMADHPEIGALVLEQIGFPQENPLSEVSRFRPKPRGYFDGTAVVAGTRRHHEKYGGNGYPDQRSKRKIPLVARVIKIADSAEAMRTRKAERFPTPEAVVAELLRCRGTDFDSGVDDIAMEILPEWWEANPL